MRDEEARHTPLSMYDLLLQQFGHLTISSKLHQLCMKSKIIDCIIFEKLLLQRPINPKCVARVLFEGVSLSNIQKHSLKWPHFQERFFVTKYII